MSLQYQAGFLVSMWLTKPKTYFGDPSYTLGVASFVEPILWSTLAVGYHGLQDTALSQAYTTGSTLWA